MAGLLTAAAPSAALAAYLRTAARVPFRLGSRDCATFVAGWLALALGRPVDTRLHAANAASVEALPPREIMRIWSAAAVANGLVRTPAPRVGDVGLVRDGRGLVGAVSTVTGWARVRDRALVVSPERCVAAWSIGI